MDDWLSEWPSERKEGVCVCRERERERERVQRVFLLLLLSRHGFHRQRAERRVFSSDIMAMTSGWADPDMIRGGDQARFTDSANFKKPFAWRL